MGQPRDLAEQLGQEPPPGVAALPADQRELLATALADARRQQAAAIRAAAEESLRYVPALLRGAVRRAVGL
ncbi:hypothetical protein SAMN05421810_101805 [Amycolatopsis arida]|uniref:Uncharacterized protein n=1 Tax=Amycolatopsis arida TaxID=587909 RepID=A0A1I5M7I2_9PSEU|nr:hypothetical protein [Amycolatopsis arida]TDX93980.1 hypothetical protein CLV69_104437 [Amycolatopsis arida]SFP04896.1 hypothetical protein SAMN05421810_101805 [Amycolatopsis arida]